MHLRLLANSAHGQRVHIEGADVFCAGDDGESHLPLNTFQLFV
jgi:hypothetical protein